MARRRFVAAYQSANGNIIPITTSTVSAEFAEQDAEKMRSPEDETEVFVAFRDEPDWQRLG